MSAIINTARLLIFLSKNANFFSAATFMSTTMSSSSMPPKIRITFWLVLPATKGVAGVFCTAGALWVNSGGAVDWLAVAVLANEEVEGCKLACSRGWSGAVGVAEAVCE